MDAPIFGCTSNVAFVKSYSISLKAFSATSVYWIDVLSLFDPFSRSFNGAMFFAGSGAKRL